MTKATAIIVFVRAPEMGKVKTRLAASIGPQNALRIYKHLLQHTRQVLLQSKASIHVFFSDNIPVHDDYWMGKRFKKHVQCAGELGERMKDAFKKLFAESYAKLLIVGSDCPALEINIINNAFDALDKADVVIGPAVDGGYYLLGMKTLHQPLFEGIPWSSSVVLSQTIATAQKLQLSVHTLPTLSDVDTEDDLPEDYGVFLQQH